MITVWTTRFEIEKLQDFIFLPTKSGAKFLHAAEQNPGVISFWFQIDTDAKDCKRIVRAAGTGYDLSSDDLPYMCTILLGGGALTIHFFDIGEEELSQ